jgi:hypothetical protein
MKISDTPLMVRLPASRKCFEVRVLSQKEKTYSEQECDRISERAILLTSDSWKMLKTDIQANCQTSKCKQLTGAADGLFIAIDTALKLTPIKK